MLRQDFGLYDGLHAPASCPLHVGRPSCLDRVDRAANGTHSICQVGLNWETAYAKSFQIQTSNDGTTWTPIYTTTTGAGGIQNLTVSGSGRYIRMYGTVRATQYGYSLWEFQVYTS